MLPIAPKEKAFRCYGSRTSAKCRCDITCTHVARSCRWTPFSLPTEKFRAVYYKARHQPQLILRERTKTNDHELLADVWKAANNKAREMGWIDVKEPDAPSFVHCQKDDDRCLGPRGRFL